MNVNKVVVDKDSGNTSISKVNKQISFNSCLADICVSLAGLCVEKEYYGLLEASCGSSRDLENAIRVASELYTDYGFNKMSDTNIYHNNFSQYKMCFRDLKVEKLINKCERKTRRIVNKNLDIIVSLAHIISKKGIIDGITLYKILDELKDLKPKDFINIEDKYIKEII